MIRFNYFSKNKVYILTMSLFLIIFILSSKNSYAETISLAPGKTFHKTAANRDSSLKLSFDWRMPDRYGLDRNGNGIIDIPNTSDYVYNREFVQCKECVEIKPADQTIPGGIPPGPGNTIPRGKPHTIFDKFRPTRGWSMLGPIACLASESRLHEVDFVVQLDNSDSEIPYHKFETGSNTPKGSINARNDIALIRKICSFGAGKSIKELDIGQLRDENGNIVFIDPSATSGNDPTITTEKPETLVYIKSDVAFVWSVRGQDIDHKHIILPFVTKPEKKSREFIAALPEGRYQIEMFLLDLIGNKWNSVSKEVTVKDHLIVALGDSFSAGEGTPEAIYQDAVVVLTPENIERIRRHHKNQTEYTLSDKEINDRVAFFSNDSYIEDGNTVWVLKNKTDHAYHEIVWADDGGKSLKYEYIYEDKFRRINVNGATVLLPMRTKRKVHYYNNSKISDVAKRHNVYHRSSFTHSSQFALELEKSDEKSSVTYLNLAMSGATINEGITGISNGGSKNSPYYHNANTRVDQIKLLSDTVGRKSNKGTRTIDAVILTVGGNDVGFKHIIEGMLGREQVGTDDSYDPDDEFYGPTLVEIDRGFNTGEWNVVESNLSTILQSMYSKQYDWDHLTGCNSLQDSFRSFWDKLQNIKIAKGNNGKFNIFTFGYPSMGHKCSTYSNDACLCNSIMSGIEGPFPFNDMFEITHYELAHMKNYILPRLNGEIKTVSNELNWNYVDDVFGAPLGHGLCMEKIYPGDEHGRYSLPDHNILAGANEENKGRWFRELREAAWLEKRPMTEVSLAAHPNEYGYKGIMKKYYDLIVQQLP